MTDDGAKGFRTHGRKGAGGGEEGAPQAPTVLSLSPWRKQK